MAQHIDDKINKEVKMAHYGWTNEEVYDEVIGGWICRDVLVYVDDEGHCYPVDKNFIEPPKDNSQDE